MKKSRCTNEQIVRALRRAECGTPVVWVCRALRVSEPTFHRWKKRFGAPRLSEVRELRRLRDESRRLKQVVAGLMLAAACCRRRCGCGSARTRRWRQRDRVHGAGAG